MNDEFQNMLSFYGSETMPMIEEFVEEIQKILALTIEDHQNLYSKERKLPCLIKKIPGVIDGQKFRKNNIFSQVQEWDARSAELEGKTKLSGVEKEELSWLADNLGEALGDICTELHEIIHGVTKETAHNTLENYSYCRFKEITTLNSSLRMSTFVDLSKKYKENFIHWVVKMPDKEIYEHVFLNGDLIFKRRISIQSKEDNPAHEKTHDWILSTILNRKVAA